MKTLRGEQLPTASERRTDETNMNKNSRSVGQKHKEMKEL